MMPIMWRTSSILHSYITAVATLTMFFPGLAWPADQPNEPDVSGVTAAARSTYSLDAQPSVNRLDFDFRTGESSAWLNRNGDFHVHGWIRHGSLLCATYSMGIRFGVGAPGCLNVEWISEPVYVTSQYQCNSARLEHDGGESLPAIGAQIAKISCAQEIIRCIGSCK
jgi:hypothetical protein